MNLAYDARFRVQLGCSHNGRGALWAHGTGKNYEISGGILKMNKTHIKNIQNINPKP
jgi:hypothetical protein